MEEKRSSSWEEEKFIKETAIKERELELAEQRLQASNRLVSIVSVLVPVVAALITAIPAFVTSQNQQELKRLEIELKRLEIEGQLITNSTKTGDPDQAAENLKFLVESGLLSGETGSRVSSYLEQRNPGVGRALPTR